MRKMLTLLLVALLHRLDGALAASYFESLAVRRQLAVLNRKTPRPRLHPSDRWFWVLISSLWPAWRGALAIVKPATVIGWHRKGFRLFWTWKSRSRRSGRPPVSPEVRGLIRRMCRENPLWGAPRIHGELLKLGFEVSERTVSRYILQHPKPPSQTHSAGHYYLAIENWPLLTFPGRPAMSASDLSFKSHDDTDLNVDPSITKRGHCSAGGSAVCPSVQPRRCRPVINRAPKP